MPTTEKSSFEKTWRQANDTFLAPFVAIPNVGLAAVNQTVGTTARASEMAWKNAGGIFGDLGKFAEDASGRVAKRSLGKASDSVKVIRETLENAGGNPGDRTSNELLATTILDESIATLGTPVLIGTDVAGAALENVPFVKDTLESAWRNLSGLLDKLSNHGVLSGSIGRETNALIRFGFYYMSVEGPTGAVIRDFRGIVGGVVALSMGDFKWLYGASRDYWSSMEYVYDKWLADETQPDVDLPIGALLAKESKAIIENFPEPFVKALGSGDPREVARAMVDDAGQVTTLLSVYPFTAFQVLFDVVVFVARAYLQPSDTLNYAICELALVEGTTKLSREKRLEGEKKLRMTAGNATVEFEYYVPLLVPLDGNVTDQAHRKNILGETVDHGTISRSVFEGRAIDRAQAITSEVIQLRAFLWLYGDEKKAREKSFSETERKFGKKAAERIKKKPLYPLSEEDIKELTKEGKRTEKEVHEKMYDLMHHRGLLEVADTLFGRKLTKDSNIDY